MVNLDVDMVLYLYHDLLMINYFKLHTDDLVSKSSGTYCYLVETRLYFVFFPSIYLLRPERRVDCCDPYPPESCVKVKFLMRDLINTKCTLNRFIPTKR
jgi:hypothetical protein